MNDIHMNRRQALIASGLGALSLGMPGAVMGSDELDASGNAVAAEKSCIFVLLCGGPSHVDTWDMKPDAPDSIRGPYKSISTKVPGMRLNEMHTQLAKVADQFTLINSMTHPGAISNHFDAMHNLLSGQSVKRVQQGMPDDQPYIGSFVAKHKPSTRNIVSNAWLIKCVGRPVFCAPNIGIGGYLGSAYAPVFVGSVENHPAMENFSPPPIYDLGCVGRIISLHKLSDGRFNIVLQGLQLCIYTEQPTSTLYRRAKTTIRPPAPPRTLPVDIRVQLESVAQEYLQWRKATELSQIIHAGQLTDSILVNNLSAGLDFTPLEKQFLLESEDLSQQARRLTDLLRFKLADLPLNQE